MLDDSVSVSSSSIILCLPMESDSVAWKAGVGLLLHWSYVSDLLVHLPRRGYRTSLL